MEFTPKADAHTRPAPPIERDTPVKPNCWQCHKFFGTRKTSNLCSKCYVELTGDTSFIAPSVLLARKEAADYAVHFAASSDAVANVLSPRQFATWMRVLLLRRVKMYNPNIITIDTIRKFLVYEKMDDSPSEHYYILAESAHQLVKCLRFLKCPVIQHHYVHHIIFSHVLDTWNIDSKVSGVGACYYDGYGRVPGPTFSEIKGNTNRNIADANMRIESETRSSAACFGALAIQEPTKDSAVAVALFKRIAAATKGEEDVKERE